MVNRSMQNEQSRAEKQPRESYREFACDVGQCRYCAAAVRERHAAAEQREIVGSCIALLRRSDSEHVTCECHTWSG